MLRQLRPKSAYARNVITLMTGTALAQAIPIAISPILTRLYSPEEFGKAALYLSCVAILSLIVTGRYELAVTLPATDEEAAHVVTLTLKLSALSSLLLYLPILFLGSTVALWLGNPSLTPWFYLLPVSVFAAASFNVFQFWCNRKSQYRAMSVNRIQNAILASTFNVLLGVSKTSGGMILGTVIGQAIASMLIGRRTWSTHRFLLSATNWKRELALANRYSNHPKHIAPAQLIGAAAIQIPLIMVGSVYSLAALGFFSLAYRMVSLPSALIAGAIGDVYRKRISDAYSERGEFQSILVETLSQTALLAFPPFALVYIVSPPLFELVFGAHWRVAGEYAQILVVAAFFQFVFTPIDKGAVVVGATRYILAWHLVRLVSFVLLFYAVRSFGIEIEQALWSFVLINSVLYLTDGLAEYRLARKW